MKKDAGILMPVLSLPGKYGCGDFGKTAFDFIDRVADAGFCIWQILPLQPLGYGQSPYQPYSSKAMDDLYISLDVLAEEGLIDGLCEYRADDTRIAYQDVRAFREKYLRQAYSRFAPTAEFEAFCSEKWVDDYAVFLTLKLSNSSRSWQDWSEDQKFYPENHNLDLSPFADEIRYQKFLQFILLKQWKTLLDYAHSKGLKVMGDVPFFVGLDSDDVWWHKDMFLLDSLGRPTFIAGVPPDSFSATGQRWGNPIYNWDVMQKDGFSFWIDRLHYASTLYDITRIDHFRAFSTYWKVPASCPTAMDGQWIPSPGYEFFDELFRQYPEISIVAEDLGDNMKDVYVLRDHFNLKGMVITQQMFDYRKYTDTAEHRICYTGTHDNQTVKGWYESLPDWHREEVRRNLDEMGFPQTDISDAMNDFAMSRSAETVVLPVCDIMRLDDSGRINQPGVLSELNWSWKLADYEELDRCMPVISQLLVKYSRQR